MSIQTITEPLLKLESATIEVFTGGARLVNFEQAQDIELTYEYKQLKADNAFCDKFGEIVTVEFKIKDIDIAKLNIIKTKKLFLVKLIRPENKKITIVTIYAARVIDTQEQRIKLEGYCDKTRKQGDQLYNYSIVVEN